ncbi:MAG: hypothetical protein JF591_11195 [Lysobacter sp.]|nr:hypothetical protein [Lysobacter sp.]
MYSAEFLKDDATGWSAVACLEIPTPQRPNCRSGTRVGIRDHDGAPLLRIDVFHEYDSFNSELRCSNEMVVIGVATAFHVVWPEPRKVRSTEVRWYICEMQQPWEMGLDVDAFGVLISSSDALWHLDSSGQPLWRVDDLGIDGVVISDVRQGVVHGSGEWDPPGGWLPFEVDLRTGRVLMNAGKRG